MSPAEKGRSQVAGVVGRTARERVARTRSPLHFARFEFKYVLAADKRRTVEEDMRWFLELDPFVVGKPGSQYVVRSLYYDDPGYSCYHDKIDGIRTRSKFRVRTYATDSNGTSPLFLEIKGRHNNLVFKHRTPVSRDGVEWGKLQGGGLSDAILSRISDGSLKERFRFELLRRRLVPVALIDYVRRPYRSKFDPGFRATFDDSLRATRTRSVFPDGEGFSRAMLTGYTVLEIKFRHHLPAWFHRVIQVHELRQVSISKICAGMEALRFARTEA